MIIPSQLDMDWLHSATELILSGKYRHRQEGKTVAYIMLMIGEVELGAVDNNYLYIGHNTVLTNCVSQEFCKAVKAIVPTVSITKYTGTHCVINGIQNFFFLSLDNLCDTPELIRALALDRVFFDIDDVTQHRADASGDLTALFQQLAVDISYRRGDVI